MGLITYWSFGSFQEGREQRLKGKGHEFQCWSRASFLIEVYYFGSPLALLSV